VEVLIGSDVNESSWPCSVSICRFGTVSTTWLERHGGRAIFIIKTKTRTEMIAIRLLKLKLN